MDIAHSNVDRIFDYKLPEGMQAPVGSRILAPFGRATVEAFVIGEQAETDYDPEKIKCALRVIDDFPVLTEEQLRLAEYIREEYRTTLAFALRLMFPAAMRRERVKAKRVRIISAADREKLLEERRRCFTAEGAVRARIRLKTIDKLLEGDCPSALLDGAAVRRLLQCGAAAERYDEAMRHPYAGADAPAAQEVALMPQQQEAVARINGFVDAGQKQTVLLHGVTGSGKTQVYLECVGHAVAQGKPAIILVPEIALTPQLYGQFLSRFGQRVAVFHSGLSDGERFDEWRRVRSGAADIILGARSAIFMPVEKPGLIIMDEEHAESYKAENHPAYHAADIARMRAHLAGATLVLASATPRLESYMKAKLGIYALVEMPQRARGLLLPEVFVVDMKREFMNGNRGLVSGALHRAIGETLERGEQALLFLNRRGFASSVVCPVCGHVRMCSHCDVPLKYHKSEEALLCHYCGRTFPFARACPDCGEPFPVLAGVGTEQAEAQVRRLFPSARVLRMDFDTTRKKDAHMAIYEAFRAGEADILVGTQMIARGLDFGNVTLSAILSADSLLNYGGYRAEENTFAMIEQVAGRAGRSRPGRVIVQTYNPEHYAIRLAAAHDYAGMYREELAYRRATGKPPFTRIYRLVFSGKDAQCVKKTREAAEKQIKEMLKPFASAIMLFVAKEAPVAMLDGQAREHILVKAKSGEALRGIRDCMLAVRESSMKRGITVSFDVDPYDVN